MKFNLENIEKINEKIGKNSSYDVLTLREKTRKNPKWLHFGAGNIFRGYIARLNQDLIEQGKWDSGIIVAESFDKEIIEQIYAPYDFLALAVTLHSQGDFSLNCINNLAEALTMSEMSRLSEIISSPGLQIISFTITEKGYNLFSPNGEVIPMVQEDIQGSPKDSRHLMGMVTQLLYQRYQSACSPIALLSLDNCSENGNKLKNAIIFYAEEWIKQGEMEEGFLEYLTSGSSVSFPWSMIDKITPRPAKEVQQYLEEIGWEEMDAVVTARHTYIAPYVNLEEAEYLVVEDDFPNGRPPLEEAGVLMTDRKSVARAEKMKVTACLNPLHTALAVFGCLLGYESISQEMKDKELVALLEKIGYQEALPVVEDPKILSARDFIDEVLQKRLVNPYIPDTPQRIATDTSQKIPIRFGETIKAYMQRNKAEQLVFIPLVLAGWLRYLLGVDDEGNVFSPSPDPLLAELQKSLEGLSYHHYQHTEKLDKLLENETVFGVNLHAAGLSERVKAYLREMCQGKFAIRNTLMKYLG